MLRTQNLNDTLPGLIRERIHILDGAMGTMISAIKLDEAAVRGKRSLVTIKIQELSDILCITHPMR